MNSFLRVLLVCLVVTFVGSTPAFQRSIDGRIVGGVNASIEEIPHQVSLLNRGRHACGGSIIASDIILTAAHCVKNSNHKALQVRVGSSTSNEGGVIHKVVAVLEHEGFSYFNLDNDVALLITERDITFDLDTAAVRLPEHGEHVDDGALAMASGWGATSEGGSLAKILQRVFIPIVNQEECSNAYGSRYEITPRMICAGVAVGGKDSCQGDSGGPLTLDDTIIGIVSWGIGCARPGFPGVYTRVSSLREWIDVSIEKLRSVKARSEADLVLRH